MTVITATEVLTKVMMLDEALDEMRPAHQWCEANWYGNSEISKAKRALNDAISHLEIARNSLLALHHDMTRT